MIRGSLLLLLTFAIFAQAFGYAPTYRFRFLKSAGRPPKPFKPNPKPPQPTTRFIGPVISFRAALPPVLGLRPMAMPMPMPMPMPIPMVPAPNFIGPNPGGLVAAFVTPAVGAPNTALGFVPGPLVPTPRLVQPVISPHQNFTLLSKHSSGPSVTATVFRAPGGLSATSVQRGLREHGTPWPSHLDLTDSEDSVMTTHSAALVTTTVAGPATEATVMASPASAMAGASAVVMASASSVTCAVPALVAQVPPGALLLHLPGRLPVQAANNQQLLSHLGPYQQW
uniref:Putative conserved secreted protein n=1 Tax=Rhipicephalus microplus TaxID=6941 RepID=A0A6G5A8H5_RHIMP